MSPRSLLTSLLALLLASLALAPAAAHAVAPIALDLRGVEHDHAPSHGDERELIRAHGDGAKLVLRERVECDLQGARCGQLHGGVAHGACEESLVNGRLTTRHGALRLRGVGRVCAGTHDRERLWLVGWDGTGDMRGVRAVLEVRIVKTQRAAGGEADAVSIDTIDLDTLAPDGRVPARAAADASQLCVLCELLASQAHAAQERGVSEDQATGLLARMCALMPEAWTAACDRMLTDHGLQMITWAYGGLDARSICVERLGFRDGG